jgi:hypothetical protein
MVVTGECRRADEDRQRRKTKGQEPLPVTHDQNLPKVFADG